MFISQNVVIFIGAMVISFSLGRGYQQGFKSNEGITELVIGAALIYFAFFFTNA